MSQSDSCLVALLEHDSVTSEDQYVAWNSGSNFGYGLGNGECGGNLYRSRTWRSFSANRLGFGQSPNGFLSVGGGFTPTQTAALSSFQLALRNGSGTSAPNVLNAFLFGSIAGNPGGLIEMLTLTNVLPANPGIVTVDSLSHPTLQAGTLYFIVVNDGASPAFGGFSINSTGSIGPVVQGTNINALVASNQQELAFRVNGTAVPETSTLGLLTVGFIALIIPKYTRRSRI